MDTLKDALLDLTLGNGFVLFFQILGLIILVYFLFSSIWSLRSELIKEKGQQGNFPALGAVYMILSALFIFMFIANFDEFVESFSNVYNNLFSQKYGEESEFKFILDKNRESELSTNLSVIKFSLLLVLLGFSANFSKSFFTLNSLEFGVINGQKLVDTFKNKSIAIIEALLRFIIAFIFIVTETEISFLKISDKNIISEFNNFSFLTICLYSALILWLIIILKWTSIDNIEKWKKLSRNQFIFGLLTAIAFFFFSNLSINNIEIWTKYNTVLFILIIVLPSLLLVTLYRSEINRWKQMNSTNDNVNEEVN